MIILDYDNVLLPTAFLAKRGLDHHSFRSLPSLEQTQLKSIAAHGVAAVHQIKLVQSCLASADHVFLISNASSDFMQATMKNFLRELYFFICSDCPKLKILSARSAYSNHVKNPKEWKCHAFEWAYSSWKSKKMYHTQLVVLGDSEEEFKAAEKLRNANKDSLTLQLIKFRKATAVEQLFELQQSALKVIAKIEEERPQTGGCFILNRFMPEVIFASN